jgi:hypothetical protein
MMRHMKVDRLTKTENLAEQPHQRYYNNQTLGLGLSKNPNPQ